MVKAPSSHGLDRKYKSWRRGKSQHSKRRSSLKQLLRGHERLLTRTTDETHRQQLESKIQVLQQEIAAKQVAEQERQHARKSHGIRFLERQKLTRMEQAARKINVVDDDSKNSHQNDTCRERQLTKTALDQVYVAHYPMQQQTYKPLFVNGVRRIDDARQLTKRAAIRREILTNILPTLSAAHQKSWIAADQYARVRQFATTNWSDELEAEWFGCRDEDNNNDKNSSDNKGVSPHDERFTKPTAQQEALLAAAQAMEDELDQDEELRLPSKKKAKTKKQTQEQRSSESDDDDDSDDSDSDDASNSGSDHADPLKRLIETKQSVSKTQHDKDNDNHNSSSSSDGSSVSSSDDDDDSSSSSTSESEEEPPNKEQQPNNNNNNDVNMVEEEDDDDDFLIADSTTTENAFDKPHEHVPPVDSVRGDKSQGWATQRQRPGQFRHKSHKNKNNNRQNTTAKRKPWRKE